MQSRISLDYDYEKRKSFIRIDVIRSPDLKDGLLQELVYDTSLQSSGNMYLECIGVSDEKLVYNITQGPITSLPTKYTPKPGYKASVSFILKDQAKKADGVWEYQDEDNHLVGSSNKFSQVYENVENLLTTLNYELIKSIEINIL